MAGGKSSSTTAQTQTQQQTDNRQVNTDSHDSSISQWIANTTNESTSNLTSNDSHNVTSSIADSGNSSWASSVADSGNTSNSGNTSTVVNWTGTDTGSLHLADLATQLAGAAGEQNLQALSGLEDLAATQGQNQLQFATHMLDTTGDLIGKFATGISAQANAATLQTAQASAQQQSNQQLTKYLLIGGGVIALAIIMKKG